MGICTRGVFPALDFTADFPPAAPGFYQRTHCVHLKNLGTTDKNFLTKSSTKRFREYSILTGSRKTGNLTHTLT